MADTLFGIFLIASGITMILFPDKELQSLIDYQNSIFKFKLNPHPNSKVNRIVGRLVIVFGIMFIILGTLMALNLAFNE